MNRRRPWNQRLVRKVTRRVPLNGTMAGSPLGILLAFSLLGCLLAVLFG